MLPKMTLPTQLVLMVLLADPGAEKYGLQICQEAGLATGTIHPILARLERAGWVTSEWEDIDPAKEGRPRRRYYRLESNAVAQVQAALHRASGNGQALRALRPGLVEGS